jgi:YidC/Oxa1 family membrane protein insertase
MNEQRNLFIAMALALAVIVIWEIFINQPMQSRQRAEQALSRQQAAQSEQMAGGAAGPAAAPGVTAPVGMMSREQALAAVPRVRIDAAEVDGSLSLTGARLDDLNLKGYRVALAQTSPEVTLLKPQGSPHASYAVFGWVGDGQALPNDATPWRQVGGDVLATGRPVTLAYETADGLTFERKIAIDEHFMFTITDKVTNTGAAERTLYPFSAVRRYGEPPDLARNMILHEGMTGVINGRLEERKYARMLKRDGEFKAETQGGWLGITDKYWLTAIAPPSNVAFTAQYTTRRTAGATIFEANTLGAARRIAPNETIEETTRLFAGAKRVQLLNQYRDAYAIPRFEMAVDWGNFWFLTKPFFWLLDHFFRWVGNFGVAIMMLTVVVRIIFFPIVNQSYVVMTKMKALQPRMEELRNRYKNDQLQMQKATAELFQKEKVNPLAGCLPILFQIPVFYALYKVLFVTIEMRHAPFFGWIQDLSAPDPTTVFNLFGLLPYNPTAWPVIGSFLALGALPLLYGITMWMVQSLSPPATDPIQAAVFKWLPVLFTFMMMGFAAGLLLYWTWSNVLSILQQSVIMRRMGVPTQFDLFLEKRFGVKAPSAKS